MPYQDLLKGRVSISGQVYLVTTVTHQRQRLFLDLPLGRRVVQAMIRMDRERATRTLAYVVMPDHFHWLLVLGREHTLGQTVRLVKGRSARMIDQDAHRKGNVWQRGYHEHALRDDESLIDAARYTIMNPVRAGLVTDVRQYSLWDAAWVSPENYS